MSDSKELKKLQFEMETPAGTIRVWGSDTKEYPGVWTILKDKSGKEHILSLTEYNREDNVLQTVAYADDSKDEPTDIIKYKFDVKEPYVVDVTETFRKAVVVYAEDGEEARKKVEGLYDNDAIKLDLRDYNGFEIEVREKIREDEVKNYDNLYIDKEK